MLSIFKLINHAFGLSWSGGGAAINMALQRFSFIVNRHFGSPYKIFCQFNVAGSREDIKDTNRVLNIVQSPLPS